jgi:hypothetical protein
MRISGVFRAAKTDDDRGGRVFASRPLDAEPLAQLGSRSARDVVIFLVPRYQRDDVVEWLHRTDA